MDVISFGETIANEEKLQNFHEAVNNNGNSEFLPVPSGPHNLSDYLSSFPLFSGAGGGGFGGDESVLFISFFFINVFHE